MADIFGRIQRRAETSPALSIVYTGVSSVTGPLVTDAPTGALTTQVFSVSNTLITKTVVGPADQSSITSSTHSNTSSAARSTATASASDTSQTSSSNLNTLIPAIVAPVAAVLLFSFIGFWLFMRRRAKRASKNEPEFVMEGMKEKPKERPITADSNSSTRELVPTKAKETAVNVREVQRPVNPSVAKETSFAPPRLESAMSSRPGSRQADGQPRPVPNFSRGPRSHTMSRDITASPAPELRQEDRGGSRAGHHQPPTAWSGSGANNGARGPDITNQPQSATSRPTQPRHGSFSRPLGPQNGFNRGPPASATTRSNMPERSEDGSNTHKQSAGAYNGSSPISQYSPIIKDAPKFGTTPMAANGYSSSKSTKGLTPSNNDQGNRRAPPSAIKTGSSPISPTDPSFSDENMRIARLANNSRLGFHSMVATTAATSPASEEPPTPSPRLPPPATRDAPPTNYNIPLPTHEPPAPAHIQARLNGASISDRRSVVSGLSDDYVDLEVDDNKSDVSSLDEREKWQIQSDSDRTNTRQAGLGGYGGLGARPPLISTDGQNSDASDSQYSLGYYAKESDKGRSR